VRRVRWEAMTVSAMCGHLGKNRETLGPSRQHLASTIVALNAGRASARSWKGY
jgi:hypothetical protein